MAASRGRRIAVLFQEFRPWKNHLARPRAMLDAAPWSNWGYLLHFLYPKATNRNSWYRISAVQRYGNAFSAAQPSVLDEVL
jgi:hypothetical protein